MEAASTAQCCHWFLDLTSLFLFNLLSFVVQGGSDKKFRREFLEHLLLIFLFYCKLKAVCFESFVQLSSAVDSVSDFS